MKYETVKILKSEITEEIERQNLLNTIDNLRAEISKNNADLLQSAQTKEHIDYLLAEAERNKAALETSLARNEAIQVDALAREKEIDLLTQQITKARENSRKISQSDLAPPLAEKLFLATTSFPDENLEIARQQLLQHGLNVIEYMPLESIRSELSVIMAALNNGSACNEKRLDHLLRCLEYNKEYINEEEQKRVAKRAQMTSFVSDSLAIMRGYIPIDISRQSEVSLHRQGLSKGIAKRIFKKNCLWLIRMRPDEISRLHEADLLNRYSPEAQQLDLVEMTAIYGSFPDVFLNDSMGRKNGVRLRLEDNVYKLLQEKNKSASSSSDKYRHRVYKDCPPPFTTEAEYISNDVMSANSLRLSFTRDVLRPSRMSVLSSDGESNSIILADEIVNAILLNTTNETGNENTE